MSKEDKTETIGRSWLKTGICRLKELPGGTNQPGDDVRSFQENHGSAISVYTVYGKNKWCMSTDRVSKRLW